MGQKGFSLIEVLIGVAILSIGGTALIKSSSNQKQTLKHFESKRTELEVFNQIRYVLAVKTSCDDTLGGLVPTATPTAITSINRGGGTPFISVNQKIGANLGVITGTQAYATLSSLSVRSSALNSPGPGTVIVNVGVQRDKGNFNTDGSGNLITVNKDIFIGVITNAAGAVTECLSEADSVADAAKETICESMQGVYEQATQRCRFECGNDATANGSGPISIECLRNDFDNSYVSEDQVARPSSITGNLQMGGSSVIETNGRISANTQVCTGTGANRNCRDFLPSAQCPLGQVATGFNAQGNPLCVSTDCPAGQYFNGLRRSGGSMIAHCIAYNGESPCPANQYVHTVSPDGTVVCRNFPAASTKSCSDGYYMRGVTSSGSPICSQDIGVYNETCPPGEYIYSTDGNGVIQCRSYDAADSSVYGRGCTGAQEVLNGFTGSGNPICICIPSCPRANQICDGRLSNAANGCGGNCNVVGTQTSGTDIHGYTCTSGGGGGTCSAPRPRVPWTRSDGRGGTEKCCEIVCNPGTGNWDCSRSGWMPTSSYCR